jgi:hypothetical protein
MAAIDPSRTWALLELLLAGTANDRHRAVVNVVLEHAKLEAEPVWDLDRLMATLSRSPVYLGRRCGRGPEGCRRGAELLRGDGAFPNEFLLSRRIALVDRRFQSWMGRV